MDLLDANILIGAFRPDDPNHATLKEWLEETLNHGLVVTFPALVEVAFLRIVTHPRIFRVPSPLEEAVSFLQTIQESGQFREMQWTLRMRTRWWRWCRELALKGNDVNDAYIAATAAEARCRLVSLDGGFSRFSGLDWWNPVPIEEADSER
ncbi:MAG TPA: TA system VapC family ribonuclease toxin [Thermoanaerobaculia bacterium]|nr:TA system VapC family ribonuclease toxin [Thermoanaerobaculia bacterium]